MILIFAVRMKLIEWKGSYCSNKPNSKLLLRNYMIILKIERVEQVEQVDSL